MKFCIPVPCFFGSMDFAAAIYKISELGFCAAETYNWKSLDKASVRVALNETGVELLSMCTSQFCMTTPSLRRKWLDGLRESCEAAYALGVRRLITQVGNDTGEPREFQHESIVCALREAAPILEKSNVTLMIEPLNTLVDHPGYYLTSSSEAFEIVREADHPLVKVVYDIYHQQVTEGNIINNIVNNLDCIAHLHCAGHPGRTDLQLGENDYKVIFDAVDRAGYKYFCGLEYHPSKDSVQSLEDFKRIYM